MSLRVAILQHEGETGHRCLRRVASLSKHWLLGTHHGGAQKKHFDYYLDEFIFRFNRRQSAARGQLFYRLLEGAVATRPTTRDLIVRVRS
jgi:hypothetical protein